MSTKNQSPYGNAFKYFGATLVALAVIGLIFVSVSSGRGRNQQSFIFGRYASKNVEFRPDNAFGRAVERQMTEYSSRLAGSDNPRVYDSIRFNAWWDAFKSVVVGRAKAYQLEKSGYTASPRAIDRMIVKYGSFRTNGEFDEDLYRNASSSVKAAQRELMREQLVMNTWAQDVLDSRYYSSGETTFLNNMRSDVKTYDYISIPFSDFPAEDVLAYATENSQLFSQMPLSRITIEAGPKRNADEAEKKARDVLERYTAEQSDLEAFSSLARENSDDSYAEDGGSMGPTRYYLLAELIGNDNSTSVFEGKEGDVLGPFDTEYGWMLFRVDGSIVEPKVADITEEVRRYMMQNEVGIIEDTLMAQAQNVVSQVRGGMDFSSAALEAGLPVSTTTEFPVNYGGTTLLESRPENSGDASLSGSSNSESFWKTIIPLTSIGDVSEPVVLNNAVAVFSLAAESRREPLSYWDERVKDKMKDVRSRDFQAAVLSDKNPLFENNFFETYSQFFSQETN